MLNAFDVVCAVFVGFSLGVGCCGLLERFVPVEVAERILRQAQARAAAKAAYREVISK